MGKIIKINPKPRISKEKLKDTSSKFIGRYLQEYPPYSSPRVKGKPLFWWAREKRLDEISIPKKTIEISKLELITLRNINSEKLLKKIHEKIEIVKGDFRQKEILKIWDEKLKNKKLEFLIAKFSIKCSSGTYVRSIANKIGENLKIPSLAFSIKRKEIGKFNLENILIKGE